MGNNTATSSLKATEVGASVTVPDSDSWWVCQAQGMVIAGHQDTRPVLIIGENIKFASIKAPKYGSGWASGGGVATLTVATGASGGMTAATGVSVVEVWVSEHSGEKSPAGAATSIGAFTSKKLNITSNSFCPTTELLVTHREFYLKYLTETGVYYRIVSIPYTGGSDTCTVDVSSSVIVSYRPLETQCQTGQFPAVGCAEYWRGRLWGANIASRTPAATATITFTNGSNVVTLANDTFEESDVYRSIVNLSTNQIYAYISRVLTSTTAEIIFADIKQTTWTLSTTTLNPVGTPAVSWQLGGDSGKLYATPIYVGEAAAGITYGMVTFNSLDIVYDENLYASGAQIKMLKRLGDDLLVIYDRAVVAIQGDLTADSPPIVKMWLVAENVGSFYPKTVWADGRGTIWFLGNGRIYRTTTGQIVDVSEQLGVSSLYDSYGTFINTNTELLDDQRAEYDMGGNRSVVVGLCKQSDKNLHQYGYIINHSQQIQCVQPMKWPVPLYCLLTTIDDTGTAVIYAGSKDRHVYQMFVPWQWNDTYTDPTSGTYTVANVTWHVQTGIDWMDGTGYIHAIRLLLECDTVAAETVSYAARVVNSNRLPWRNTWYADLTHTLTATQLDSEVYRVNRIGGKGFIHRVYGTTDSYLRLLELGLYMDVQPVRAVL